MTQRLLLIFFSFALAAQVRGQSSANIPNVIMIAGNIVKDCRGQIDSAAAQGVNLQTDFIADPTHGGWGYHFVLEFKEFPEARVFPPEVIARNREQMRANLKYAAQKGVKIYLSHYNFCATRPFVNAHPDVNRKNPPRVVGSSWNPTPEEEQTAPLIGDLCWQNEIYRKFMVSCWTELFETYPELAGLIIGVGEFNGCPDERGGDPYVEVAKSFVAAFDATMRKFGKPAIVREWGLRKYQLQRRGINDTSAETFLPQSPIYMMRFSSNNNVTEEPDEENDLWRKNGREVWIDTNSRGGNVGPFFYVNPRFQHAQIASLVKRNIKALRVQMSDPGANHTPLLRLNQAALVDPGANHTPLLRLNQAALVQYAHKFEPYNEKPWIDRIAALVGQAEAASVLHACEDASAVILGLPRVVSVPDDGLNFSGFHYFPPLSGSPATLGTATLDPLPEWRRGLTSFRDIIKACAFDGGYTEGIAERVAAGRPTPFQTLDSCIARSERGVKTLEEIHARLKSAGQAEAAKHVAELLQPSKPVVLWGRYWNEMLRARLAYEGVMRGNSESLRAKCAGEWRQHYDSGVALLEMVVNALKDKGNINDTLRQRREHRGQILEKITKSIKIQPFRARAIPVGTQVIRNPRFQNGSPDDWDSAAIVGEASFGYQQGPRAAVSVSSGDYTSRASWSQSIDGNFRQGRYRLHARYRLEDVRSSSSGGVIRLMTRREDKRDGPQIMIELGKGMSPDWQTLDRDIVFDDEAVGVNVGLFLWFSMGKISFQEATLTRIE